METRQMDMEKSHGRMEGWLYLIRSNRFGLQYARKRYFILEQSCLKSFKSQPSSVSEVFFIFSLYNASNHNDCLKLGASNPEEAARWIHSLQDVAVEAGSGSNSKRRWQPYRLNDSKSVTRKHSVDWTSSANMHVDAMTSDVIAPSQWKIFGCKNGLRLFKEAKDCSSSERVPTSSDYPAIMAVGVIEGTCEAVFRTFMSLGLSRSEWDFCFHNGSVVEHLDGHTDIIHIQLCRDWLPWYILYFQKRY
ncbi:putative pleckstrin domain, START-like domain superfamily [Helianthus annuus]|nr:putative pleckstrin domain, START-like domain superfamily [Helianthus annuus]